MALAYAAQQQTAEQLQEEQDAVLAQQLLLAQQQSEQPRPTGPPVPMQPKHVEQRPFHIYRGGRSPPLQRIGGVEKKPTKCQGSNSDHQRGIPASKYSCR